MIIFQKIRFKNILSFGNTWTEIVLDASPITLVRGKNGSGKSGAVLDTICFALFGKSFRKINKPQLVNYKNQKDLLTEISFETPKGNFLVRRGQNPTIFEIYHNGVLRNQDSTVKDYQLWFEQNVLQFDYNTFTQIVILGKATFVSFMQLNLDQRRKFVENVLGLNIFSIMSKIHKTNVQTLKEDISQIKTQILLYKERKDIHEIYIKNLKKDKKKKEEEEDKKVADHIALLEKEINDIEIELDELNKKKKTIDQKLVEQLQFKERRFLDLISKAEAKNSQFKKEREFFENHDHCPTCNQDIPPETKQNQIESNLTKLNGIKDLLTELRTKSKDVYEEMGKINKEIEKNHLLIKSIDVLLTKKNEKLKQINDLNHFHNTSKKENTSAIRIEDEINKLKLIEEDYETLLTKKSDLLDELEYYDLISNMLDDNGIKRVMVSRFMPFINSIINSNLKKLGFNVKLTFDENFSETILSLGLNELNYFNYSEGEKLRIDLAILMAWREVAKLQNNMNSNLLIFDETFDGSLDSNGIELFIDLLLDLEKTNVFIITHSPEKLKTTKIKENLFFEKQTGYSKLVNHYLTTDAE